MTCLILVLLAIGYGAYVYLRERAPTEPLKPTVPASADEPNAKG